MADCKRIVQKKRIICAGDLKHYIEIQTRKIEAPLSGVDHEYDTPLYAKTWAMIQTVSGLRDFDKINVGEGVTHLFYIRYLSGVTEQEWVIYNGQRFDIADVENLDEENQFMKLECIDKGDVDQAGSEWE